MDIVESNDGAVKQSSSSAQSQASSEVSVEQTKTGSIESSVQQASSLQQSSSSVVQSSATSSVSGAVNAPADSVVNKDEPQTESKDVVDGEDDEVEVYEEEEEDEVEYEEVEVDGAVDESTGDTVKQEQRVVVEETPAGTVTTVITTTTTSGADPSSAKSTITKTTTTKSSTTTTKPTPQSIPVTQSPQNTTTVTQVETVSKSTQPPTTTTSINSTTTQSLAPAAEATLTEAPVVVSSSLQTESQTITSSSTTVATASETTAPAESTDTVSATTESAPEPTTVVPTESADVTVENVIVDSIAETVAEKPSASAEIKQEDIKNSLKEIISDIDKVIEEEEEQKPELVQPPTAESTHVENETTVAVSESAVDDSPKEEKVFNPLAPATDEPAPHKDRKLYASSAFFTPGLHPTVEDQFELARMISSSLCDSNNKQSKGQTMYVNRKNRSVKWVHEDVEQENVTTTPVVDERSEPVVAPATTTPKSALSLVMNPSGQVHDMYSLQNNHGFETTENNSGMLSPNKCAELVNALHSPQVPQGKGADLFAKRRKHSEKWVVDGSSNQQSGAAFGSPVNVPFVEKQANTWKPSLATNDQNAYQPSPYYPEQVAVPEPNYKPHSTVGQTPSGFQLAKAQPPVQHAQVSSNSIRDLAYKPSIPQGWNAPAPVLPKDLYTPAEIPLNSYVPPVPVQQPQLQSQPIWDSGFNHTPYNPAPVSTLYQTVAPAKQPVNNAPTPTPFRRPLNTANTINQQQRGPPAVAAAYLKNAVPAEQKIANAPNQIFYQQQQQQQQPPFKSTPQYGPPKQTYSPSVPVQQPYQPVTNQNQFNGAAGGVVRTSLDLSHAENYNRAARGWGQSKGYYRPITFNNPNHTVDYSDF